MSRHHVTLAALAAALTVAACAEHDGGPAAAALGVQNGDKLGTTYTVSGTVYGFRVTHDSTRPGDSTSTIFPLANVLVEAVRIGDIPQDSGGVPGDTAGVPSDSGFPPPDSTRLWYRGDLRVARQLGDSAHSDTTRTPPPPPPPIDSGRPPVDSGPRPPRVVAASDRTARDGSYSLRKLPRGIYEVSITRDRNVVATNWIWVTQDRSGVNFYIWTR